MKIHIAPKPRTKEELNAVMREVTRIGCDELVLVECKEAQNAK